MEYQWDQAKAAANLKKHGIAFSDAALALEDPPALTIADPDAIDESRYICLGADPNGRILINGVCATWPRNTHYLFAKGQPF
jgi:uncharacterized protein